MPWRMEFNCMSSISALHVTDKSWGQYKADLGIIKYVAIAQHFEDKCDLYLTFFFSFHGVFLPQTSQRKLVTLSSFYSK